MPELPEVETVRMGLAPRVEGRRIKTAVAFTRKLRLPVPDDFAKALTGARIDGVTRRAKYLLFETNGDFTVILHLGMSGQVLITDNDGKTPHKPEKHDHFVWDVEGDSRIVFRDPRRFGLVTFCDTAKLADHPLLAHLGPEPLSNAFNGPALAEGVAGRKSDIKAALLDQKVVAGVGNIYACEALFRAGINPKRKAGSLSAARTERLTAAVRGVLQDALKSGGSSLRDYVRVDGELGYFQHSFDVYGREGEACRQKGCEGTVKRFTQGARSTFYCPRCQK